MSIIEINVSHSVLPTRSRLGAESNGIAPMFKREKYAGWSEWRSGWAGGGMSRFKRVTLSVLLLVFVTFCGCQEMIPRDTASLLLPRFQRSEIFGLVAGFGTTFAALPDLIVMLRRKSSKGMNPRMAAIMGIFQILWVYYGLLILSRPVVIWNVIAVLINSLSVGAYFHFRNKERAPHAMK